jgi:hypothetical protein
MTLDEFIEDVSNKLQTEEGRQLTHFEIQLIYKAYTTAVHHSLNIFEKKNTLKKKK